MTLAPGTPLILGSYNGFGVVQHVNLDRGVALVSMQNGKQYEMNVGLAIAAVEACQAHEQHRAAA